MVTSSVIEKYFDYLADEQKHQFELVYKLYSDWNQKINVISRKDIKNLYIHHVLHSLGIAKFIAFKPNVDILDLGTGGGFPGIPLAILFPTTNFHLVDSIGKKITVVNEVAKSLGLANIEAEKNRAENLERRYDFVVGRAVSQMPMVCSWARDKIKQKSIHNIKNGLIYLKGDDAVQQMKSTELKYSIYNLSDHFEEDYFLTKKIVHVIM